MNNDVITETYLNMISEEYHRSFLWTMSGFEKIIVKMVQRDIKKLAFKKFENYFVKTNVFSFVENFKKIKPTIQTTGQGDTLTVQLRFTLDKWDQIYNLLMGLDAKKFAQAIKSPEEKPSKNSDNNSDNDEEELAKKATSKRR